MKVYVVVSNCGSFGPYIHGVYEERPTTEAIQRLVYEGNGHGEGIASMTEYQFTVTVESEFTEKLV